MIQQHTAQRGRDVEQEGLLVDMISRLNSHPYLYSDWEPDTVFFHWNSDEGHESCSRMCTYLTEAKLQDTGEAQCRQDWEFENVYPPYLGARDALTHARAARGFFPVVIPSVSTQAFEEDLSK